MIRFPTLRYLINKASNLLSQRTIKIHLRNILFCLPFFYLLFYLINTNNVSLSVTLDIPSELGGGEGQIFWDSGQGLNEKESKKFLYPKNGGVFTLKVYFKDGNRIKKIRFDPFTFITGKILIKNVTISENGKLTILPIHKMFNSGEVYQLHSIDKIEKEKAGLMVYCQKEDPYFTLIPNLSKKTNRSKYWYKLTFLSLLSSVFFAVLFTKLFKLLRNKFSLERISSILLYSSTFFLIIIFLTKSFVSILAKFYYKQELSNIDLYYTYVADIAIATGILVCSLILLNLILFPIRKILEKFNWIYAFKIPVLLIYLIIKILLCIGIGFIFVCSIYYLLSAYVFFEWGAFLEPQHLFAAKQTGVFSQFIHLAFRFQTIIFIIVLISLGLLTIKATRLLQKASLKSKIILLVILLFIAGSSRVVFDKNFKHKPSVYSPLVLMFGELSGNTDGISKDIINDIKIDSFKMPPKRELPLEYSKMRGIAADMNVVFVILESVRKNNLDLYGYHRNTMPFLSSLTEHSLVFHNAYVNQPRSCKTMASLILGTYPDPRMHAITWDSKVIDIDENIIKRILDKGYKFYFGTTQKFDGDGFYPFLKKSSGNRIDRAVSMEQFVEMGLINHLEIDESIVAIDFVKWAKNQSHQFLGILWSQAAHFPYETNPQKPFGMVSITDKYDNSLFNLDGNIKALKEGLEEIGKLENTLIIILGDHGEAVGDKLDWGHGNFLYDHSLRIPFIIYNPVLFPSRSNQYQRFQIKDIPSTILFLMDLKTNLNQSEIIFTKTNLDKIYLTNVYQDYKMGMIFDDYKFVWRPKMDLSYLFNLKADPNEDNNVIGRKSLKEISDLKEEMLQYYKYQLNYLNHKIYDGKLK